jgi:hypothetical protein
MRPAVTSPRASLDKDGTVALQATAAWAGGAHLEVSGMGDGMPYHLEKGPTLRILEDTSIVTPQGMVALLGRLRTPGVDWFVDDHPLGPPRGGMTRSSSGARWPNGQALARRHHPEVVRLEAGPGHRVGRLGQDQPDRVLDRLQGRPARDRPRGIRVGGGDRARHQPRVQRLASVRSWPIEIFWKCPEPWFEAWVTVQPIPASSSAR